MKIRTTATRRLEWDSAHRVMNHESKCATLHGHRYVALVTVEAAKLDEVDRVIDFGVIKQIVGKWIDDNWDHTTMLNMADTAMIAAFKSAHGKAQHRELVVLGAEPTAEVISQVLLETAQRLLDEHVDAHPNHAALKVVKVRLYETPNCYADAEAV